MNCFICKKNFYATNWEIRNGRKFCSHKCYWTWKKGNPIFKDWLEKIRPDLSGENNPSKRPEVRKKISKGNKGKILSKDHRTKLSLAKQGKYIRENHPNWKGGRHLLPIGYIVVWVSRKKYQYEHVLIMEKHLGRKLKKNEIIHHINGVKTDNRIENLMLFNSTGEHLKYHFKTLGK